VPIYFFDTSALAPRYSAGKFSRKVNRIFRTANSGFYLCDLTIIEMSSTLAQVYRRQKLSIADFHAMRALFEDDIATGVLSIRTVTQADLINARDLLEDAAVSNNRNLRSADAIIASSARQLAYDLKSRVIFYTHDWTQYASILGVHSYRSALKLRYLGKGKGGIAATTG
jgi:predicted nucleic acid-binding protein